MSARDKGRGGAERLLGPRVALVILGSLAGSCAQLGALTATPPTVELLAPTGDVQLTMALKINGKPVSGLGVVPRAAHYKIEGKAPDEFDVVTLTSCGRRVHLRKPGDDFTFDFDLDPWMEGTTCAFLLEGLDQDKGKHALGYFLLDDPDLRLESLLHCNGEGAPAGVVARGPRVCQTGAGVWVGLRFLGQKVTVEPVEGCPLEQRSGSEFRFRAVAGHCAYVFRRGYGAAQERMTFDVFGYRQAATWGNGD